MSLEVLTVGPSIIRILLTDWVPYFTIVMTPDLHVFIPGTSLSLTGEAEVQYSMTIIALQDLTPTGKLDFTYFSS